MIHYLTRLVTAHTANAHWIHFLGWSVIGASSEHIQVLVNMHTFQQWLESQTEREDIVGDFAFTILRDDELPTYKKRGDEHQIWATWPVNHTPSQELINAFNVAWEEYQAANSER